MLTNQLIQPKWMLLSRCFGIGLMTVRRFSDDEWSQKVVEPRPISSSERVGKVAMATHLLKEVQGESDA
jgi:hypothetical protein